MCVEAVVQIVGVYYASFHIVCFAPQHLRVGEDCKCHIRSDEDLVVLWQLHTTVAIVALFAFFLARQRNKVIRLV